MVLKLSARAVFHVEVDRGFSIGGSSARDVQDFKAQPFRLLGPFLDSLTLHLTLGFSVVGTQDEVDVASRERGITRSQQRFRGRGFFRAFDHRKATAFQRLFGSTGAKVGHRISPYVPGNTSATSQIKIICRL